MSQYSTMQGSVKYPDEATFKQVVQELVERHWMNADGHFIDETGDPLTNEPNISKEELSIDLPCGLYRNLGCFDFFLNENGKKESKVEGTIIGTSTDGQFVAWEIENGNQTNYNLFDWAEKNLEKADKYPPKKQPAESEEDFVTRHCEWQNMVEREFHNDV